MTKFVTGDHIRVIKDDPMPGNDKGPDILKGQEYPVEEIYICKCGEEHVDIGELSDFNIISCYKCREELPGGDVTQWCHSSRFEKVNVEPEVSK